ncbi:MAG: hypothetical protein IJ711_10965, partial [Lachnospiraceae bacterium]|nr:hypothetical protein [Lachnospiraceae bacterium]
IKVFPGWIGHIADIRGDAENAEEWYGQIVQGILWRQMGLIFRDEQGNYRIIHQLIEEYLVETGRRFQRRFAWRRGLQTGIVTAAFLLVAAACYRGLYLPYAASHVAEMVRTPYDEALSETVRDIAFAAYSDGARQYETVTKLLETLQTDEVDEAVYEQSLRRCLEELKADTGGRAASALRYEERLLASGEVMPWSGQPLPVDDYEALAVLAGNRAEDYLTYVTLLDELRKDEGLWDYFGESYLEELSAFLDCDAYVLGKYYQTVLEPEFAAMAESDSEADQTWYHRYMTNLAYYPRQDAVTQNASDTPEKYEQSRFHALTVLRQNGAFGYFRSNTEE